MHTAVSFHHFTFGVTATFALPATCPSHKLQSRPDSRNQVLGTLTGSDLVTKRLLIGQCQSSAAHLMLHVQTRTQIKLTWHLSSVFAQSLLWSVAHVFISIRGKLSGIPKSMCTYVLFVDKCKHLLPFSLSLSSSGVSIAQQQLMLQRISGFVHT